ELQDLERALLLGAGLEPVEREGEAELDVAASDADPALKVLQPGLVDPRIVLGPVGESLLVNLGGKQLRERRTHRFLPGRAAREIDVRIDGDAPPGQDVGELLHARALETYRFGEAQP